MEKKSFNVTYNGKPVSVNSVNENTYLVQITYKPMYIKLELDDQGTRQWYELETNSSTMLAKELGELIMKHQS